MTSETVNKFLSDIVPEDDVSSEDPQSDKVMINGIPLGELMVTGMDSVRKLTASSKQLPKGDDFEFALTDVAFKKERDALKLRALKAEEVLATMFSGPRNKPDIVSIADEADRMEAFGDLVDSMLEAVDGGLDLVQRGASASKKMSREEKLLEKQMNRREMAQRPQNYFKVKPDNSAEPFRPLVYNDSGELGYGTPGTHPYRKQILAAKPLDWQLRQTVPKPPPSLDDTPCHFVSTRAEIEKLRTHLLSQNEFAVDLEHHHSHSFLGFTCLVQISTREADYIIDALEARDSVSLLLPAFASPSILKVLHGASSDIEWLQRDFGIYVVNMFDTLCATEQLGLAGALQRLLLQFCSVQTDKSFQTADWRVRPLGPEMMRYARTDTHYLLYIADQLRNKLLLQESRPGQESPLARVLEESKQVCLRQYQKPTLDGTMRSFFRKHGTRMGPVEKQAAEACLQWRDIVARKEDEGTQAVLSDSLIDEIAREFARAGKRLDARDICKLKSPTPRFLAKHVKALVTALAGTEEEGGATEEQARVPTPAPEENVEGWHLITSQEEEEAHKARAAELRSRIVLTKGPGLDLSLHTHFPRCPRTSELQRRVADLFKQLKEKHLKRKREEEDEDAGAEGTVPAPAASPEAAAPAAVASSPQQSPPAAAEPEKETVAEETSAPAAAAGGAEPTSLRERFQGKPARRKLKVRKAQP